MKVLLCCTAAIMAAAVPLAAQGPKLPPCDTSAIIAHASPVWRVGKPTLVLACPAYAAVIDSTWKADSVRYLAWGLPAYVKFLAHGVRPPEIKQPTDTTPIPPPTMPTDTTPVHLPSNPTGVDTVLTDPAWSFCVNAGNVCTYLGLRTVRLATVGSTKSVTQVAPHAVPCANYGFSGSNLSGSLHCDTQGYLARWLKVPRKMGPVQSDSILVPLGSGGSATEDSASGGGASAVTPGFGSIRFTASLAKYGFIDPIVFPGRPDSSHLHVFFGNVNLDAFTNASTIRDNCRSTIKGGRLNCTGYWMPAVLNASGKVVIPDEATFYYKSGYDVDNTVIQPLPTGLKIVAGDKNATGRQMAGPLQKITWTCLNGTGRSADDATIPSCKTGDAVRMTIIFPQCWDGQRLDSPDHQSHMGYPAYDSLPRAGGGRRSVCRSTHPVTVPEITEHFDYPVQAGENSSLWHLSSDMDVSKPGGLSAHADWMMGWDPNIMKGMVQYCLNGAHDCGVGSVGLNLYLFTPPFK